MHLKNLVRPFVFFVGGVIISVVGLGALDITQVSATISTPSTRANVAQRANLPTRTLAPTSDLLREPTVAFGSTETPASISAAVPTVEASPTVAATLTATFTPSSTTLITTAVPTIHRVLTQTPRVSAASGPTATPTLDPRRGDSPYSALEMTDTWKKLASGASLWFKAGKETSYPLRGSVWVDAPVDENGRRGLSLAIYSPEQVNDLNALTIPKGRGSYNKIEPRSALFWKGGSPNGGIWYAYLTNNNSFPVEYKIGTSFNVTDRKSCFQYWEYIGPNLVLWTECNRPPGP